MPISIEGKRIIITGGARGIGAATAEVFAREGASVVTLDVLDDSGQEVAERATQAGPGTVRYLHADVSNQDEVVAAVNSAVSDLGGLDAAFCIAGIEHRSAAEDIPAYDWDATLAVNVKGVAFCNQAVFPHMKDHGGSIVNFGSGSGLVMSPTSAHYGASKGAVMAYTRQAAYEWGKYGIRVNSVAPAIWTPMYEEFRLRLSEEELAAHDAYMKQTMPLGGRLGDPVTDLAPVLVFLASDASKFITDQIIVVDGGVVPVR